MRKAARIMMAASLTLGGVFAPLASADAQTCIVAPPGYDASTLAYRSTAYGPYPWINFPPNYSNFILTDCAYYNRRFYGAYIVSRSVRYARRYYP